VKGIPAYATSRDVLHFAATAAVDLAFSAMHATDTDAILVWHPKPGFPSALCVACCSQYIPFRM
jgi:hypothetical protein